MYQVYALVDELGKHRYIGLTQLKLAHRLRNHRYCARRGYTYPVYTWMREVGPEKVDIVLVKECSSVEEMEQTEIFCIESMMWEWGEECLNVNGGGFSPRIGPRAERQFCNLGHAMTAENTYVVPTGRKEGHRRCRICRSASIKRSNNSVNKEKDRARNYKRLVAERERNADHRPHKIWASEAKEIRELFATGCYAKTEIADMYQVSAATIANVIKMKFIYRERPAHL